MQIQKQHWTQTRAGKAKMKAMWAEKKAKKENSHTAHNHVDLRGDELANSSLHKQRLASRHSNNAKMSMFVDKAWDTLSTIEKMFLLQVYADLTGKY